MTRQDRYDQLRASYDWEGVSPDPVPLRRYALIAPAGDGSALYLFDSPEEALDYASRDLAEIPETLVDLDSGQGWEIDVSYSLGAKLTAAQL